MEIKLPGNPWIPRPDMDQHPFFVSPGGARLDLHRILTRQRYDKFPYLSVGFIRKEIYKNTLSLKQFKKHIGRKPWSQ